ncbi:MAG TPA: hypothetical protein VFQ71_12555 [Gaiellales bacterium]|jgi:hypothetical protein|nr:hypothetical protein [Gaiellales bacterium]
MKRRGFLAGGLLSLPVLGGVLGWAMGEPAGAGAAELRVADLEVEAETVFWEYLDHCSSWRESVERIRDYVADGHADAEVFAHVAEVIESDLRTRHADPDGTLGFYPAAVLTLTSLCHLRACGSADNHRNQVDMLTRLAREV